MAKKADKRQGKVPALRRQDDQAVTSNQHVTNPQQDLFLDAYLLPDSPTFGNAYKSALKAGYGDDYARQILSPAVGNQWIKENTRFKNLSYDHLTALVDDIATTKYNPHIRLKAIELSAKLKGLMIEKKQVESKVITVSLGELLNTPDTASNGSAKPQTPK